MSKICFGVDVGGTTVKSVLSQPLEKLLINGRLRQEQRIMEDIFSMILQILLKMPLRQEATKKRTLSASASVFRVRSKETVLY